MNIKIKKLTYYPDDFFYRVSDLSPALFKQIHNINIILYALYDGEQILALGEVVSREWDSQHFGKRIGELVLYETKGASLDGSLAIHLFEKISREIQQNFDMLFCRVNTDRKNFVKAAETTDFRLMDTQVEYEFINQKQPVKEIPDSCILRPAELKDLGYLKEIARNSFFKTRFHADAKLGKEASDLLYQIWVEKSVQDNYADRVVVAQIDDIPVGFATWNLVKAGDLAMGRLELTAVSETDRNKGIYTSLVNEGIKFYRDKAISIYSSTQINNIAGQRVWIKLGLTMKNSWYIFHRWFK